MHAWAPDGRLLATASQTALLRPLDPALVARSGPARRTDRRISEVGIATRCVGEDPYIGQTGGVEPELSVRHRPVQARGRERFELILRTPVATSSPGSGSTASPSTASPMRPASRSDGSIYQFFPNSTRHSRASAQDTDAIVAALGRAAEQFPSDDWQTDVDRLIDHLADLWRSEPGRRHVWLAMQSTALTRSLAAEQTTRIAEQIVPLVAWLMPEGSRRRARTVAAVVVQMCYSLLHFSVHDDRPHPATVRELKRALRSYLRAVALDAQG